MPKDVQDKLPKGITENDVKKYIDLFGEDRAKEFLKQKGLDPKLLEKFKNR